MPSQTLFCDRDYVEGFLKGNRVAIVGSGPGVLDNKPGFIDGHEVVVRVNNYQIRAPATGRRTDIFYSFFGNSIRKTVAELKRDGVFLCMSKCPDAKVMESQWHARNGRDHGVDFRTIYEQRRAWWFCPTYVPAVQGFMHHFDMLGGHVPTTGFAAILDVLSFKPESVYLTGFDFFSSGIHNVDEKWRAGLPDDPIGHVPDRERAWLNEHQGRLPVTMDQRLSGMIARPIKFPEPERRPNDPKFILKRRWT